MSCSKIFSGLISQISCCKPKKEEKVKPYWKACLAVLTFYTLTQKFHIGKSIIPLKVNVYERLLKLELWIISSFKIKFK